MTNTGFYQNWIDSVALASWVNNPHTAHLVKSNFMAQLDTISNASEIPAASICASAPLTGRTAEAGVMRADNVVFTGLTEIDSTVDKIIITDDTTGDLVLSFGDVSGLNIIPEGNITLVWNTCGLAEL